MPFAYHLHSFLQVQSAHLAILLTMLSGRAVFSSFSRYSRQLFSLLIILQIYLSYQFILVPKLKQIPNNHSYNLVQGFLPHSLRPLGTKLVPIPDGAGPLGVPTLYPELLNATWMGEWPIPKLISSKHGVINGKEQLVSPALLMLHIFSTITPASRERRQLIRENSPLFTIPQEYRHLVELKFVPWSSTPSAERGRGRRGTFHLGGGGRVWGFNPVGRVGGWGEYESGQDLGVDTDMW